MNIDPTNLRDIALIATGYASAFLIGLWLSLIFWAVRDIRRRSRDPLLRILATLVVILLFIPGILIYLILRPHRTLEEDYQQTLEEEALLQSIEDKSLCPACGRRVRENWIACPSCHTRLKKKCPSCNNLMDLSWNLCPVCGLSVLTTPEETFTPGEQ